MNREEAKERLEKTFFRIDHDNCIEPDPHFVDEAANGYPHDGCLVIKCWNCQFQDHFLYNND